MSVSYDKHYKTESLFGSPYPELIAYFTKKKKRGKVLDMGCGQGRDALAIAKLGFHVLGLDKSEVGINQMLKLAQQEGLPVQGKVIDLAEFTDVQDYDFVLFDSMFHFLKQDREQETALVTKTILEMKRGTELVVCIQDSGTKAAVLQETISASKQMQILEDLKFSYVFKNSEKAHNVATNYRLIVARKTDTIVAE